MTIQARSKLTSQGQVSVPAVVRRRLGLGPGATLEWVEEAGGRVVVRRAAVHDSAAVHAVLFPASEPPRKTLAELRQGVALAVRRQQARD